MLKLSIIIPVYNEKETIVKVLRKLKALKGSFRKEIIVIDDGSTDGSALILNRINTESGNCFKLITHKENRGKGSSIRTGIQNASGDFILIQDADLEYDPNEIPGFIKTIQNTRIGENSAKIAIYGSRFMKTPIQMPFLYVMGNRFLTRLMNLIYHIRLTDMETGYKLIPTSIAKKMKIRSDHFDMEPEITAKLIRSGIPIIEIPISYSGRTHVAGKKLTVVDAIGALRAIVYYRFFN
ncbi:MAG: glycosyltransferase family 2 protein [Bacteroidota bacterium]